MIKSPRPRRNLLRGSAGTRPTIRVLSIALAFHAATCPETLADLIAGWNAFSTPGNVPRAADALHASAVAGTLTDANIRRLDDWGGSGVATDGSTGRWNNLATIDPSQYLEFSVDTGATAFDFDSFQIFANNDENNLDLTLRSSVDAFTSDLGTFATVVNTPTLHTVDLSTLTGLTGSTSFRLYGTNADSITVFLKVHDSASVTGGGFVAVTGTTTAVPEPSSFLLFAGTMTGLLMAGGRRRRTGNAVRA